jgi:hypothetical protein
MIFVYGLNTLEFIVHDWMLNVHSKPEINR